jgi:hypothetical protein
MAQLAQIEPHARATVAVSALFKALSDQDSQLGVFFPTLTILLAPMRSKAAFADFEGLTQSVSAILMLELFHHREARGGISADKTSKAFLKMSRGVTGFESLPAEPLKTKEMRINKGSPGFSLVLLLLQIDEQ